MPTKASPFQHVLRLWVSQFNPTEMAQRLEIELNNAGLYTVDDLQQSVARSSEIFSALRAALQADAQALEACAAQTLREQAGGKPE
jgi:hypothetical protein